MSNDNLAQYLDSLDRAQRYRTDAVLKSSGAERTERVFLKGSGGEEAGPFIRKTIKRETGIGKAYERIFARQQEGFSSAHIPRIH